MGGGSADSLSSQYGNVQIAQQYAGTCNINCNNSLNDVSIILLHDEIGGNVDINQQCSANSQCIFSNNIDSQADTYFSALNSSNAASAPGEIEHTYSSSLQDIQESILDSISQQCNISSTNQVNNVTFFAQDSTIGGNFIVNQDSSVSGTCELNSSMSASALATGASSNCSASGKKSKLSCKGMGGGLPFVLVAIGLIIVIIIAIFVYRHFYNKNNTK
jgi:hypothetical protein